MDAATLPPPPPPPHLRITPAGDFTTAEEAKAAANELAAAAQQAVRAGQRFCLLARDWLRRRGPQMILPALNLPDSFEKDGRTIRLPVTPERAVGRVAEWCGMSKSHFYRCAQIGHIREILAVAGRVTPSNDLTDWAIRPLALLIADHPDEIEGAFATAFQASQTSDRSIGACIRDAVDVIIPPDPKTWADLDKRLKADLAFAERIGRPEPVLDSIRAALSTNRRTT